MSLFRTHIKVTG